MSVVEYSALSKSQKLAVFLVTVGPDSAAKLLGQFDDEQVETVSREMAAFEIVNESLQLEALKEFGEVLGAACRVALGGADYTRRILEMARGEEEARSILIKARPTDQSMEEIRDLSSMDGGQIFTLIKGEQPQTIALIISFLDAAKAAEIISNFDAGLREEIMERLCVMGEISAELAGKILANLNRNSGGNRNAMPVLQRQGGTEVAAAILKRLNKEVANSLLANIEARDPKLSEAVRRKMFSFENIAELSPADVQRILRDVDLSDLALALKSASEKVRNVVYGAMSKRAAESVREELESLGPVRLKDVETAQDGVIAVIRTLEESGEVTISQEGTDEVVE